MIRLSVTGDSRFIDSLEGLTRSDVGNTAIVDRQHTGDRSELAFGVGDLATLITILSGTVTLADLLIRVARTLLPGKPQKVRVKSAAGEVVLEIHPHTTAADLMKQLESLGPPV